MSQIIPKKYFPDKVTKAFIFDTYSKKGGIPLKIIRNEINYYIRSMGGNVRKRNLNDLVVLYFIERHGFTDEYKISIKIEIQFQKLGYTKDEYGNYKKNNKNI
ncbi:hypothetical protein ACSVH2_03780 [Flavobacterium sp. RSB2_4_14]|uniref:hypothetical protein n=1 Tax=Flavobacterium sp. RSB2_4_14 TaxID=3447665 RepID=UPI003F335466